jgi:hypothetical protein
MFVVQLELIIRPARGICKFTYHITNYTQSAIQFNAQINTFIGELMHFPANSWNMTFMRSSIGFQAQNYYEKNELLSVTHITDRTLLQRLKRRMNSDSKRKKRTASKFDRLQLRTMSGAA